MRGLRYLILTIGLGAGLLLANYLAAGRGVPVQKSGDGIQTGSVSGRVFQPDLQAAAGASVAIKLGQGNKFSGATDKKGMYFFSGIPAGTGYAVSASKDKLKATKKNVNVTAGKNTTVDLVLEKKK